MVADVARHRLRCSLDARRAPTRRATCVVNPAVVAPLHTSRRARARRRHATGECSTRPPRRMLRAAPSLVAPREANQARVCARVPAGPPLGSSSAPARVHVDGRRGRARRRRVRKRLARRLKRLRRLSDDDGVAERRHRASSSRSSRASTPTPRAAARRAPRLGLYVHCARLREVDTAPSSRRPRLPRAEVYVPIVDVDPEKSRAPVHAFPSDPFPRGGPEPKTMGIMEPKETLADGAPRPNLETHATDGPLDVLLMPGLGVRAHGRAPRARRRLLRRVPGAIRAKCAKTPGGPNRRLSRWRTRAQILEEGKEPSEARDRDVDAIATARHGSWHVRTQARAVVPRK